MLEVLQTAFLLNGTPSSQLSTPRSTKSSSSSPTSPGSLRGLKIPPHYGSASNVNGAPVQMICLSPEAVNGNKCLSTSAILDKYKVGKVIGDGNFAVVKECIERSTGKEFALKIIDKAKCSGKEHLIENEVAVLRRVKHPNIIMLIEEVDTVAELYLVMELVKGGDLFDAITSSTKYTEKDASAMVYNLASALKYLHCLNIVHRDIKPENLLVCEYPDGTKSLKLGDFGLATVVEGPLHTVCGTPTYVAPEIIAETGYGLKVDIWAAGVITYILLCGFPPFRRYKTNEQTSIEDKNMTHIVCVEMKNTALDKEKQILVSKRCQEASETVAEKKPQPTQAEDPETPWAGTATAASLPASSEPIQLPTSPPPPSTPTTADTPTAAHPLPPVSMQCRAGAGEP
ncbi:UNVERIFIED_CONTAM: hypothetical protein FKN15_055217 [Acipenser sinensis]